MFVDYAEIQLYGRKDSTKQKDKGFEYSDSAHEKDWHFQDWKLGSDSAYRIT